jgi:hypothetical protein
MLINFNALIKFLKINVSLFPKGLKLLSSIHGGLILFIFVGGA